MHRVIGLGGPFIKSKDPKGLAAWYEKHLGIPFGGGTYAVWHINEKSKGFNILSFFAADSGYFKPSEKECMVNFVVEDLFGLIDKLRQEGVTIAGDPVDDEYGKFGWILDPDGNKIELWEAPAKSE